MNDESGFVLAFEHLRDDLVKRDDLHFDAGCEELQGQVGGGEFSWNGDALLLDLALREGARRDDHGPVAVSNAAAATQKSIMVLDVWVRVKRDRGYVVDAFLRFAVEGLDVAEGVRKMQ